MGHQPMAQDRFPPNEPIPLFLSGPDKETERSRVRNVGSSEVFRKAAMVFAAVAVVFAVVSIGNVMLFASVTAYQDNAPAPRDDSHHSTPAIQSTAGAEAVPGTPPRDELAAAFISALENKAEVDQPGAEALFNRFQAWAAEEDAQAPPGPQQPVQAVRTDQDVRTDIVQSPPLPKRRPIQAAHTARAQDPSPQNAQSLTRRFGWHN
jgi:hypothetical protein